MTEWDAGQRYIVWKAVFATFHRGYWLVASLYLVIDANLSAFQLITIGVAQGLVAIVCEIPAGVVADTLSRKRSLVVAHALMGSAIIVTGTVTAFPALVATQMLWGIAWTFVSGADVAWVTDELNDMGRIEQSRDATPERSTNAKPAEQQPVERVVVSRPSATLGIDRVLAAAARWEAVGAAAGLVTFGALAWVLGRGESIVVAGICVLLVGAVVAIGFPEKHFTRANEARWRASVGILRSGVALARRDREILLVFAATFLVHGAAEGFGRLTAKQLVGVGYPREPNPIVWYTLLGLAVLAAGALVLRLVETRIDGAGIARRAYAAACAVGAIGILVLAHAPNALSASIGVLLVGGIALTVTRVVGTIWVNRRTTSDVRATVHSFLAQAEYLGEIVVGFSLALLARATSITTALSAAAVAMTAAAVLIGRRVRVVESTPSETLR